MTSGPDSPPPSMNLQGGYQTIYALWNISHLKAHINAQKKNGTTVEYAEYRALVAYHVLL